MACTDADGCFVTNDIGDLGRNSDGGVFRLGCWLQADSLKLPPPEPLPLDENKYNFSYYFSVDEAFPIKT